MGIELAVVEQGVRGSISIDGPVAHLGCMIPEDKPGLAIHGKGIANHHGKIFFAYNSFYYANLTDLPTQVFRGRTFSFQLDSLMPQCQVLEGDQLKLGTALVQIVRLIPPSGRAKSGRKGRRVEEELKCRYVDCRRCDPVRRSEVVQATSGLVYQIWEYTSQHEILRASVDWLVDLFRGKLRTDADLRLTPPVAVAVRCRSVPVASWQGADVPVEKGFSSDDARVDGFEESALPAERFDRGVAFCFADEGKQIVGIGAGIIEGICDSEGVPLAGHFVLLQYPPGRLPGRDNVCVVHHVAAHVSQFLAAVRATRRRREREFELKAGMESELIFHDLLGVCDEARQSLAGMRSSLQEGRPVTETDVAGAEALLGKVQSHVNKGRWTFQRAGFGEYELADLPALCRKVLGSVLGESEAGKQQTAWQVKDLSEGSAGLDRFACDPLSVEGIVYGLVTNAQSAVGKVTGRRERVHVFFDIIQRDGLPHARIRVVDNGIGMEAEALNAIFEGRFSTKTGEHGVGAQVIAEQVRWHRGLIEVASGRGIGTVVDVLLPVPAQNGAPELSQTAKWLRPYSERAAQRAVVSRHRLEELIEQEEVLRNWYGLAEGEPG